MADVVVLSGWSLLLLTCLCILGTVVVCVLTGRPVDPLVADIAKLALGVPVRLAAGHGEGPAEQKVRLTLMVTRSRKKAP